MGLGIRLGKTVWNIAVGSVARAACLLPGIDREYRIEERLSGPWPVGPYLWLHGASLGECRMLLNLACALREDLVDCPKILITSQKAEVVSYLNEACASIANVSIAPADIPSTLDSFVKAVQPLGLVLAENELWPGYLSTLSRISTRKNIALVSGRYRRSLPFLDFSGMGIACLQTAADLGRFSYASKGAVPCTMGGDWKLLNWARDGGLVCVPENPVVDVVFLSFHLEESEALLRMAKDSVDKGEAPVLMPRRLAELNQFRRLLLDAGLPVVDYPVVRKGCVSLVSRFGLSREILLKSRSAVVGGSFVRTLGVHDFWEPLRMGVATCVGPYAKGHEDIVAKLVSAHVLAQIRSPVDFLRRRFPSVDTVRLSLAQEKKKVLDSYFLLLNFIKGLK
ncbi:glycosyltransferase N-terminal domain-containing protein [uncultured Fibrobacter sp.]|uniref:glycosyltransferase N-terminal domain-containing protein n=1 Tax=uncultured Fibrobacter sp. TaxID=261512 RepID=UPI0025E41B92|nr:glycosyltransferase N-terminal domain-containing protein [uncultured Fibrobacter sp.]